MSQITHNRPCLFKPDFQLAQRKLDYDTAFKNHIKIWNGAVGYMLIALLLTPTSAAFIKGHRAAQASVWMIYLALDTGQI